MRHDRANLRLRDEVLLFSANLGVAHPFRDPGLDRKPGSKSGALGNGAGILQRQQRTLAAAGFPDNLFVGFDTSRQCCRPLALAENLVNRVQRSEFRCPAHIQKAELEFRIGVLGHSQFRNRLVEQDAEAGVILHSGNELQRKAVASQEDGIEHGKGITSLLFAFQPVILLVILSGRIECKHVIERALPRAEHSLFLRLFQQARLTQFLGGKDIRIRTYV